MIEEAIYKILHDTSAIAAVVGTRITPGTGPQEGGARIGYTRVSGTTPHTLDKYTGPNTAHYQLNCWASTYDAARALAALVKSALDAYQGTVSSMAIQYAQCIDEGDVSMDFPENETLTFHGRRLEFEITYVE
jgi:hypothetical protein